MFAASTQRRYIGDEPGMLLWLPLAGFRSFVQDRVRFAVYVERMQLFFTANDIRAKKKVPVFLNIVVNNT